MYNGFLFDDMGKLTHKCDSRFEIFGVRIAHRNGAKAVFDITIHLRVAELQVQFPILEIQALLPQLH